MYSATGLSQAQLLLDCIYMSSEQGAAQSRGQSCSCKGRMWIRARSGIKRHSYALVLRGWHTNLTPCLPWNPMHSIHSMQWHYGLHSTSHLGDLVSLLSSWISPGWDTGEKAASPRRSSCDLYNCRGMGQAVNQIGCYLIPPIRLDRCTKPPHLWPCGGPAYKSVVLQHTIWYFHKK